MPFPEQLKYERERRGWSQADLATKLGCDTKTVSRWESEGRLPRPEYRQMLCQLFEKDAEELGLIETDANKRRKAASDEITGQLPASRRVLDIQPVSSLPGSTTVLSSQQEDTGQPAQRNSIREDWGEAPHLGNFYGRTQELAALKQWISSDHCRVVAVLGMGGVGKTVFTATLAEQTKGGFEYIFWRSLQNTPPLEHILKQCIQFVSDQRRVNLPGGLDDQLLLLMRYLRDHRCLLVLDNFESLFQPGRRVGTYGEGYEGYGQLIQFLGETQHQSCLLLTSREKLRELARLEGKTSPIRSLSLPGIGQAEGREILKERGLFGSDEQWRDLINLYSGNPLTLQLISEPIQELFDGDIARFLKEEQVAFGDINDLLDQQFHRLSAYEREILILGSVSRHCEILPMESGSLPSAPTGVCWPVVAKTILFACGTWAPVAVSGYSRAIPIG